MKNKKLNIIITISVIVLILLLGGIFFGLNYSRDDSSLSVMEKKWITDNENKIVDIDVFNNVPVYGYNGEYYLRIEKVSGWEGLEIDPPNGTPMIELSSGEKYYCFKPLSENYISSSIYYDRENNIYVKWNGKNYEGYIPDYRFTIK